MEKDSNDFFMEVAILTANKSKCVSKKVGAIIVNDGRLVSSGYNGTPVGYVNCCDVFDKSFDREEHHKWSNANEIHAEMNAILFAGKSGLRLNNSTIYCTLQPCEHCLKNIIQCGINKIYYFKKYDKYVIDNSLMKFISDNNILYEEYINKRLIDFEKYIINR